MPRRAHLNLQPGGALKLQSGYLELNSFVETVVTDPIWSLFGIPLLSPLLGEDNYGSSCGASTPYNRMISLPRFDSKEQTTEELIALLNEAMEKLEWSFNNQVASNPSCTVCPDADGAVEIDASRCDNFVISSDNDICPVNIRNVSDGQRLTMTFCATCTGSGSGITVDCFPSDYEGERGFFIPCGSCKSIEGVGTASGGVRQTNTTLPVTPPTVSPIAISPTSGDIDCTDASPSLTFTASGGVPPYSWVTTYGQLSAATGAIVTLTPPANTGSGEAGHAYTAVYATCASAGPPCTQTGLFGVKQMQISRKRFGCNDQDLVGCAGSTETRVGECLAAAQDLDCGSQAYCLGLYNDSGYCSSSDAKVDLCDLRTQAMKDADCEPCGLLDGAVVTVTDSVGSSVMATVSEVGL